MKFAYFLITVLLAPGILVADDKRNEFRIENFRAGLNCSDHVRIGWICFETEEILVTGQDRCTYDKEEVMCTWYGFEFDYFGAGESTTIECVARSSVPVNIGNPSEVLNESVTESRYSFALEPGDGHF